MKPFRRLAIVLVITVGLAFMVSACGGDDDEEAADGGGTAATSVDESEFTLKQQEGPPNIKVTSSSITSASLLPRGSTCEGEDMSPQLSWTGAPEGTQSFAIIFDDRDAKEGDYVHWVVYSIPATVTGIQEGAPAGETLPNGAKQGINDDENVQYNGPCPPPIVPKFTQVSGSDLPHRYYFKVYALDTAIDLPEGVNKYGLLRKMDGHILATGELMRRYVAKKREASTQ